MVDVPVPFADTEYALPAVREHLDRNGQVRLAELLEEVDHSRSEVAPALFELVADGEVSLLAVGEKVVIRPED